MNDTRTKLRVCQLLLAMGTAAFVIALVLGHTTRAWQAYLLNFVFWTGIAQSGVVFAAAYQVSKGKWSDAFRRMGESLVFFLPVSLVLFLVMMLFGAKSIFVWARTPVESKRIWLNVPFLTARDAFVFLVLLALSAAYVYYSQRSDTHRTRVLAPVLLISFGLGYSLIGFDLVMSLDPNWYSTLFGWYFFVSAFYAALAVLLIAAVLFRDTWGLEHHITVAQTHDMGRLLFGFCLLTGGMFWAQWLVFWYGDLPEEIAFIIRRYYQMPYAPLAWVMTYGVFLVPLAILLSKDLKRRPKRLMIVALWILAMLWLERYIWIVPSIWTGQGAPLLIEALVTAGFAGGFGWGWMAHNRRYPLAALIAPAPEASH
jgi:hypothetical protein